MIALVLLMLATATAENPLEAVVQKQASELAELKALVTSLKTRVDTELPHLQDEISRESKTVAFHADFFNYTDANYNISDGGVIPFDNIILNEGDGYDNNTGIFTAPETGLYSFSVRYEMPERNYLFVSLMTPDAYQAFGVVGDAVWQSG